MAKENPARKKEIGLVGASEREADEYQYCSFETPSSSVNRVIHTPCSCGSTDSVRLVWYDKVLYGTVRYSTVWYRCGMLRSWPENVALVCGFDDAGRWLANGSDGRERIKNIGGRPAARLQV